MQVVKKGLISLLILWFALFLFMPKTEIFYALEKVLDKQDIQLNESQIDEGLFSLTLKDITLFVQGINVSHINEIDIFSLFLYTNVTIEGVSVSESLKQMLPKKVDYIEANYSIFDPLYIRLKAAGDFGKVNGYVDVKQKKIHLDFIETKDINTIRSSLKKGEKGLFYEASF